MTKGKESIAFSDLLSSGGCENLLSMLAFRFIGNKKVVKMTEMKKIQEIIDKKGIGPKDTLYHTNRSALNSKGKATGKMRVLALKEDNIARYEYICPECGKYGYGESEFKRPLFTKCQHCGYKISVPKMKQQFKKEMKAANAKD